MELYRNNNKKLIPYGRHSICDDDIQAVVDVLRSDFLTQGLMVPRFEEAVCNYTGAKFGIAVNSGTSALHIACLSLGLGVGDVLWTSPITFVASANCALYCGAKIDFVDIDPKTYNLSVQALERKLIQSEKQNCLPKVVIPVHLCGQSCDMEAIYMLSKKYHFSIIEDASHAIGGKYRNNSIGGGQYSDITVFSFHPVKNITTGEGGMAMTNNQVLAKKMSLLRSHGITRDPSLMTQDLDGPWYYQQIDLGFNYRMTDIQAALGVSQMKRIDTFITKRRELAAKYNRSFQNLPISIQYQHTDTYSAFHLYVIRLNPEAATSQLSMFKQLREQGIDVNLHYIPVHTQPYYQKMGFNRGDFPQAESYYKEAISLPLYPTLTEKQQDKVISCLRV